MHEKVAVLTGGFSKEREVALCSGAAVARGLRQVGYEVAEVDITSPEFTLPPDIAAVFIALHGEFGEDGAIQEKLEKLDMPYTGTGPDASRVIFDKALSKQLMIRAGIMTPAYEILRPGDRRSLNLPVVVKPLRQGSSFGVHRVTLEQDWPTAFKESLSYNGEVLVEEFIEGRELTVGILDGRALPVVEIRAPDGNYDYRAKYTKGVTEYLAPAPLDDEFTRLCQAMAERTFKALGGRGFGRVDFRMGRDGIAHALELNTIPGFTETSLLPKSAAAGGIDFPELCDQIMRMALNGQRALCTH